MSFNTFKQAGTIGEAKGEASVIQWCTGDIRSVLNDFKESIPELAMTPILAKLDEIDRHSNHVGTLLAGIWGPEFREPESL